MSKKCRQTNIRLLLQKVFQLFVTGVAYYCRAANYSLVVGQWQQKKTIALENLSGQSLKVIAAAFRACLLLCLSSTTQFKLHCTLNYSQCSWFPDKLRCSLILSCNRLLTSARFFRFFIYLWCLQLVFYFIFWQKLICALNVALKQTLDLSWIL